MRRRKVAKASAVEGGELFREILKIDGADPVGEVSNGTNYGVAEFTREILSDEKMGGTIYIAL